MSSEEVSRGAPGRYPVPNDPGIDGLNLMKYLFAAPVKNQFNTWVGRGDYRLNGSDTFFTRVNFQDDAIANAPQFPGQPPRTTREVTSRGVAVGWDAVFGGAMVNTFRYGVTNIKEGIVGLQDRVQVEFRNIDSLDALTSSSSRDIPTHTFVNDTSWIKGAHTIKFGANLRFTRVGISNNGNSFHTPQVNGSWVDGVGTTYMPGAGCDACGLFPAVSDGGVSSFGDSFIPLLGIISEVTGFYNYDRDGNVLPIGDPVRRRFATDEYELFVQDSWKIGLDLTITGGVRYSLFSPPWEVDGLQVAPDIALGDWLDIRRQLMRQGRSTSEAPLVNFNLAGPANGRAGCYDWDTNNWAPRVAVAWTPRAESGLAGWLTGNGRMVVRGGYSIVYDRIGTALASNFDKEGSFGLSTVLSSPFGGHNEDDPSVRFQGLDVIPPTLPEAPPGGFPQTPPSFVGQITSALDGAIVTPYSHSFNVVIGRDLGRGYSVEAGYVGRRGRNLLVRRDAAMPANLVDPASGVDYFTAAQQLIRAAQGAGLDPGTPRGGYAGRIAAIPYWENLFPGAAGAGLTATERMAYEFNRRTPDYITALYVADEFCRPACSRLGEFAFFSPQYDTLGVQSTIGTSEYDALQLSVRKRFSDGYQFDLNYTLGYAKDLGSLLEGDETFQDFDNGGYTGFLLFFMDMFPDREATFGRYYSTIDTCDGGAGRCMQVALRYEF